MTLKQVGLYWILIWCLSGCITLDVIDRSPPHTIEPTVLIEPTPPVKPGLKSLVHHTNLSLVTPSADTAHDHNTRTHAYRVFQDILKHDFNAVTTNEQTIEAVASFDNLSIFYDATSVAKPASTAWARGPIEPEDLLPSEKTDTLATALATLKKRIPITPLTLISDLSSDPQDNSGALTVTQHSFVRNYLKTIGQLTDAKLLIRDQQTAYTKQPNTQDFYQLTSHLIKTRTPLDAIGLELQTNIAEKPDWEFFVETIKKYKALGLNVHLFSQTTPHNSSASTTDRMTSKSLQSLHYFNAVRAATETGVSAIQFNAWSPENQGTIPVLFDQSYTRTTTYDAVYDALEMANRFKVSAKGACGGEILTLKVNGQAVTNWVLSQTIADYSYPWIPANADIAIEEHKPKSTFTCAKDTRPSASIMAVSAYGKNYKHLKVLAGGGMLRKEYGTIATPKTMPSRITSIASAKNDDGVIISWAEKPDPTLKYNVYRSSIKKTFWEKLNISPIQGSAFQDTTSNDQQTLYAITVISPSGAESAMRVAIVK